MFSSETRDYYQLIRYCYRSHHIVLCDGVVVITIEFAIIIEVARLSCDGLVIIVQPEFTFGPRLNLVRPLCASRLSSYNSKLLVKN